jgi:hypothetical protein
MKRFLIENLKKTQTYFATKLSGEAWAPSGRELSAIRLTEGACGGEGNYF